ncbi:MAG: LysM peptidoglycan-binding domain-containing protein [Flavobacteriia bacterium]|nr:LysM peptidoglycan-binding domain-containing protein [Flavobacteriia bacterium]
MGKLHGQDSQRYKQIEILRPEIIKNAFQTSNRLKGIKIFHFGDSHIQGDRISGEIRSGLQKIGGNGGSGLIFPYALCRSVGPLGTTSNISGSYTWSSILKNPDHKRIGVMGYEITLQQGATFSMEFNDEFRGKTSAIFSIIIEGSSDSTSILLSIPGKLTQTKWLDKTVVQYTFETPESPKKIVFSTLRECSLWGIKFEQESGLVYQQCGVVGAQFTHLIPYQTEMVNLLKHDKPDLILFSYGTNESYSTLDSSSYEKKYIQFIQTIQHNLPKTALLITNAPDTRSNGKIPKSELIVNRALKRVADACAVSYYDLNLAMGGWGSSGVWKANACFSKDHLHFNKKGGILIGQLMEHAILKACSFDSTLINDLEKKIEANFPLPEKESTNSAINPSQEKINYYIVQSGDSLTSIAKKLGKTVLELSSLNQLADPNQIKVGQKIRY